MLAGFIISILVFFWALKTGQFKDQQRARFLPLDEEGKPHHQAAPSRFYRIEVYGLVFLVCAGLAASGALLVFSLIFFGDKP